MEAGQYCQRHRHCRVGFLPGHRPIRHTEYRNATALLHRQAFNDYDRYGNLKQVELKIPSESAGLITETYAYDDLHRLELNTRTGSADINYRYDAVGNLEEKSDFASTYRYEGAKPNAVSSITKTNGVAVAFAYDNNGNRTHENGSQQLWYNAYNKPTRISRHGSTLTFAYGADQMRYKQVDSTEQKTTLYVDKLFEQITEDNRVKHRFFIGDVAVLTMERADGAYLDPKIGFTHRDRLGSAVAITDHLGVLRETHSFDPFGKPRLGTSHDKPIPILASDMTTRGFTDHEHLDAVQLIHMNGRGYDYNLGQFLSVDPFIQGIGSQGLNPYSYIMNNPLSGIDPSGYLIVRPGDKIVIDDNGDNWLENPDGDGPMIGSSDSPDGGTSSTSQGNAGSDQSGGSGPQSGGSGGMIGVSDAGDLSGATNLSDALSDIGSIGDRQNTGSSASQLATAASFGGMDSGQLVSTAVEAGASLVPFGEAALLAARGDFSGAAVSAVTEGAFAVAGALTGGLAYGAYKAYRYGKLAARARNIREDSAGAVADVGVANGPGKYDVGPYNEIKGTVPGLDAHHAGQKAAMKKLVEGYNPNTGPSILVPKVGHTIKGPNGIVSRSTKGIDSARDLLARDVKELRRVYPDVPNGQLQDLIDLNKDTYPSAFTR